MNIIIAGCGNIGSSIVSSLCSEGHNVVVIDSDNQVIASVTNMYDTMGVCGNGADSDTLKEAGIEKCDLFVSVTGSDELNMLSCFLAKRLGAAHTIARIRAPEYNDKNLSFIRQELSLDVSINPEMLAASELFNILKLPGAVNIETFSNRRFEMIELIVKDGSPLSDISLMELKKKYNARFLVCAVQRGEQVVIPDGSFVLKSGDHIRLTASPTEIQKLLKMLGILNKQARSVIILGASRTAYYLSKALIAAGNTVKIIEKDRDKCVELSEQLPEAVLINGDGADQDLLAEEGIGSVDAFITLTGSDEENILIGIFAKSQSVPKVIAKINRPELAAMAEELGLESTVSPKKLISDVLSSYARALENSKGSNIETLYKIIDGKAEALEFNVRSDYPWLNKPIKELKIKRNVLIAGIIRGRQTIIPSGDDCISRGDKVIILAAETQMNDLSDILR